MRGTSGHAHHRRQPCQPGKLFAEKFDPMRIGNAAVLLVKGGVKIAAAALGDFNDRVVVLL